MRTLRYAGLVCCLVVVLAATGAAQSVPMDLGATIPNLRVMAAFAVNDSGHVVGRFNLTNYGPTHAFRWTPTGGAIDLAPGRRSWAFDVNNAGQVVGHVGGIEAEDDVGCGLCVPPRTDIHAAIWSADNGLVELGTLGGAQSGALKVNAAGQVFGWSEVLIGSRAVHAFVWTPEGGMVDLGPWPNNEPSEVNNRGDAIFNIRQDPDIFGSRWTALLWTRAGGLLELDTSGGAANGLNDKGEVVGYRRSSLGVGQAFLWTPADGMINLGTLGGASSGAADVNENGWVVGGSQTLNTNGHAFLWRRTEGMVDLGTFGGPVSTAAAVNDRGQVVGSSHNQFALRGFVWTETTGMVELPPLAGYSTSEAQLVSNGGYVVGTSLEGGTNRPTLWVVPPPDLGDWTFCAPEGGVCAFTGAMNVRYGANGSFFVRTLTDGTPCTNDVFGDPAPDTPKQCATRAASTTPPPSDWTFCATEGAPCAFTGTMDVRYGANGSFVVKTLTDGTACTNTVFGDPAPDTPKQCAIRPPSTPPPTTWTFCATEGAFCAFTGTMDVRYGASGSFVIRTLTGGTACTNEVFGDPAPNVAKSCSLPQTGP
jgi:probable HAF family extracellular repeat protein